MHHGTEGGDGSSHFGASSLPLASEAVSEEFHRLTGYSAEESVGDTAWHLFACTELTCNRAALFEFSHTVLSIFKRAIA